MATTLEGEVIAIAIGNRCEVMREEAGLTKTQVAKLMGSHGPIINRIERGIHLPDLDIIRRYARAVRCSPFDILGVLDGLQAMYPGAGDR